MDPQSDAIRFFTEYANAKFEYDEACRNLERAKMMREGAAKKLKEINQRVMDLAKRALNDPTQPQPEPPSVAFQGCSNGLR
jgi:hypothetical protein